MSGGGFLVQFAEGDAVLRAVGDTWQWTTRMGMGMLSSQRRALVHAWASLMEAPPIAADLPALEAILGVTLERVESDRGAFTRSLKRVLKARTGADYSVTGGTGTAYGWVTIRALDDYGEACLLSLVPDLIPPLPGHRARAVCEVAGVELPAHILVEEPDWD